VAKDPPASVVVHSAAGRAGYSGTTITLRFRISPMDLDASVSAMNPPRIQGLCPLIQVFDMPTSLAFYRDLLGFGVVQQAPSGDPCDWAWLARDGAELMLNTMFESDARPPTPDRARIGTHADMCLYIGAPDIEAMYEYLKKRGVEVDPPLVSPYGMKQLSLKDPDGYGICFQWRAPEPGGSRERADSASDPCSTPSAVRCTQRPHLT
jgi:glyoxylase I family protein